MAHVVYNLFFSIPTANAGYWLLWCMFIYAGKVEWKYVCFESFPQSSKDLSI